MAESGSLPGTVGRYEIERPLGQGAMGRVLLARDPILDRQVAVKMLRSDLDISVEMREGLLVRMRHEARAAARVTHPNIVTLHDMIDDELLGLCLVFEFVSGTTLKGRIAEGPSPPLDVARIAREIGSALSLAHEAGVLHRDVKPENIMLAPYGAKIADFGIARVPDSTLTRTGGLLGTPAYSAPETISGSNFSPTSDQFSLAATLYEAIAGVRAFPGDDAVTVAARIGTEEPKPIAAGLGLDLRVDQVLGRALSKDPARRFATCEAFGEALAAALEIGTMHDTRRLLPDVAPIPTQRPIGLWASVALGGAAVGALLAILLFSLLRTPAPTPIDLVGARGAWRGSSLDASTTEPTATSPTRPRPRTTTSPLPHGHAGATGADAKSPVDASIRGERDAQAPARDAGVTDAGIREAGGDARTKPRPEGSQ